MKTFYRFNFNPWNQRIGDCAIRAVSAGIGMSYIDVCKAFHVAWKKGYGLVRDTGIDLEVIKKTFNDYFGNITDFSEEVPDELKDMADELTKFDAEHGIDSWSSGITIEEFIQMFANEGRFLVGCISSKGDGHIAFVNCSQGKNFLVDTFDSSKFIVDSWMQITKSLPKDDPKHYKYDKENHCFIV